uniref:Protein DETOXIFICATION n=1 Tax=Elaeis guineensis var. tenera TaxID=51953 RepID=A0A8N4IAM1_ELAGV|nr:protein DETOXIFICATION 42 isoform X2 [Elaeis guineensis]
MENNPSTSEKQIAIPVPAESMKVSSNELKEPTPDAPEKQISILVRSEGTKESLDVPKETGPNTPDNQITVPAHLEGNMSSLDVPKDGMPQKDTKAEEIILPSPLGKPRKTGFHVFFMNIRCVYKLDELGSEIMRIAIPAALALAADPLASLVDTAFIGRLGSVEIAAVGVSIAIFNQVSKVCIYPLVSVTTSFVAEEDAIIGQGIEEQHSRDLEKASPVTTNEKELPPCNDSEKRGCTVSYISSECTKLSRPQCNRKYIPSVSSALIVGGVLGLLQAMFLILAVRQVLSIMGVKSGSPMLTPALRYLTLRSLGSPAVLLSLAMQGVFRGFKDTKTPLYATLVGDVTNIILDPILIFVFHLGVSGAAIAHVISQYLITLILFVRLVQQVNILPPSIKALKFSRFLRCGFLLLGRVIAVTFCVTLGASLAARNGPIIMAAFQICLQIWLSTSLLADGLAVAGQAILASAFARGDLHKAVAATARVLQLSIVLGMALTLLLGLGLQFGSGIFTKDINVIQIIHKGIPVAVAAVSIPCLVYLSSTHGFIGIWTGLTIYMSLRTFASTWRMGAARGPWTFIRR